MGAIVSHQADVFDDHVVDLPFPSHEVEPVIHGKIISLGRHDLGIHLGDTPLDPLPDKGDLGILQRIYLANVNALDKTRKDRDELLLSGRHALPMVSQRSLSHLLKVESRRENLPEHCFSLCNGGTVRDHGILQNPHNPPDCFLHLFCRCGPCARRHGARQKSNYHHP